VTTTIQVAQRGVFTLPKPLRDSYAIKAGEVFTVIDLGGGSFLLQRGRSRVDDLLDGVRADLEARGESLASMVSRLRMQREQSRGEPSTAITRLIITPLIDQFTLSSIRAKKTAQADGHQ
jgi:bifunctional DNA-binding transcriptional regulator/antitoxin component of YhaV-PrlF toxin-antitoxin module